MRYDVAVARLASLPTVLPAPADALRPTRLATGDWPRPTGTAMDHSPASRVAAVLVLVTPGPDGDARVILTERVDRGGHHSGEVSFPGGVAEPEDRDLVATAFREAAEEVRLDPAAAGVRVIGTLDTVHISVSGYTVTPVLAVAERHPDLSPNPDEVARIVEAPLEHFLREAPIETLQRKIAEWTVRYGAYRVEDLVVWGATARILSQLGTLVDGVGAEP
jgi:8-oxo-dGTP pyrophosphatase MutT (NUDIX family)